MKCRKCSFENIKENKFCSNCGTELYPVPFYKKHPIKLALSLTSIFFFVLFFYSFISAINQIGNDLSLTQKSQGYISGKGENKIAVINIDGIIVETFESDGISSLSDNYTSAREIKRILEEIRNDNSVKALILRVNSPGGSAAASDEILSEIKRYKSETKLPVVAYLADVAASGGYYVAMGSDKIITNPATITGSIGVILSYLSFKELADKYGVKHIVYKSGEFKNLADSFSVPTEQEAKILQSVIDDTYNTFVKAVSEGRELDESYVRKIADGRIYSANQAMEAKLVDEIGNFENSIALAKKLANITEASVFEYGQKSFLDELLQISLPKLALKFLPNQLTTLPAFQKPQLLYLANL
ncbi:MAG: signal peptide peptidase SppA [Patescibacteria group bacterium]|nr:signal peptide peptidase SppA [Patescibacteria group bacterium]